MLVLYVAGWGRSGSTLLGGILGEIPGFFAAGELHNVFRPGVSCGCGETAASCPFWQRVLSRVAEEVGEVPGKQFTEEQERVLAPKRTISLLRKRDESNLDNVRAVNSALYRAIAEETGAETIVDTSKHPGRAALLALYLEPYMIHLVRDPRATVYSWDRRRYKDFNGMGIPRATLRWLEWNLMTEAVLTRIPSPRKVRMRYEDFVSSAEGCVSRLVTMTHPAVHPPTSLFSGDSVQLGANHMVGGNPAKFRTGGVRLSADMAWHDELSSTLKASVVAATWPLMIRYGYGWSAR